MPKRLIAFGCSFTYGHGLEDCFIPPDRAGQFPSAYAWPVLLSRRLFRFCVNKSYPGNSNKAIWWNIVNFEYEPEDIVVVLWSLPTRDCVIEQDSTHPRSLRSLFPLYDHHTNGKHYRKWLFNDNAFSELDFKIESHLSISHADAYLKSKNIKVYHLLHRKENYDPFPKWQTTKFETREFYGETWSDLGLDGNHPGPKSHKQLADDLYKIIQGENK